MNNAPITPKPARKGRKFLGWPITVVAAMIIGGALLGDDETPAPETVTADVERPEAKPEPEAKETVTEAPAETVAQEQAVASAQSYLGVMGFSRAGLIEQLEFDGFSNADATYGAKHADADWNAEAAESAAAYLDVMAFSRDGLIEQLQYDGFTAEQAAHGVESVGL